jgi:HEAT repeat protein
MEHAVPTLIRLLKNHDEARGSACTALRKIGPGAKDALPALRDALSDPGEYARRLAKLAIEAIE